MLLAVFGCILSGLHAWRGALVLDGWTNDIQQVCMCCHGLRMYIRVKLLYCIERRLPADTF